MKYKHVFFIWLLADAFLAAGGLCFLAYTAVTESARDGEIFFLVIGIGILFSLPSLIVMLIFHAVFTNNAKDPANYFSPYIILIVTINILYLVIGRIVFTMPGEFGYVYIGTTLAGLLAFYLVDRKIKKINTAVEVVDDLLP
jgi:protein-S-isoprenylcysteine O-methyltransferase Ste14